MRIPMRLSQVKAFVYTTTPTTSSMTRSDSREGISNLEQMETHTGAGESMDTPARCRNKTMGDTFNSPVSTPVELVLEAAPLVVLGGLMALGAS